MGCGKGTRAFLLASHSIYPESLNLDGINPIPMTDSGEKGMQPPLHRLRLVVAGDAIPLFFRLLQQGVQVGGTVGGSIGSFLREDLCLEKGFVDKMIQTVFLDGMPVDDIEAVNIKQGSTVALSGPMPGVAGATLRRGGYYGSMRKEISCRPEAPGGDLKKGTVIIKLFNVLTESVGPGLLEKGVGVRGRDLGALLRDQETIMARALKTVEVEGLSVDFRTAVARAEGDHRMALRVMVG